MAELTIRQVARETGLRTSTLRYYEEIGLLPIAARRGGQRVYDSNILQRLAVIHTAQRAGFSLSEIAILVNEILPSSVPSPQWSDLLQRKMTELDELASHVARMRSLLEDVMHCDDSELNDCIYQTGQKHALTTTAMVSHPFLSKLQHVEE
jgi:MerR family redox-sensitive transcriptional activator SoxR